MEFKNPYVVVLICMMTVSLCSAVTGPVTAVETDNPPGSPPYNIQSISAGGYTVTIDQLATGTTTHGGIGGTPTPEMDDFDINTALDWNLGGGNFWTINFGGGLWKDTNGDNPDFFLFEYGGTETPTIAAIMPDGALGQTVVIPDQWQNIGYTRDGAAAADPVSDSGTGQSLEGMSWAITDMLDRAGAPLTNGSVILGISIVNRGGVDPLGFFAVVPPPGKARDAGPAEGASDVVRDAVLTWVPGDLAVSHEVYFSTSLDDVVNGSADALVAADLDLNAYDPDGLLDYGQTYHWRIDEVNTAHPDSPWIGEIWSFTVEPFAYPVTGITATASSFFGEATPDKTVDGSGLNGQGRHDADIGGMWLSDTMDPEPWIQYDLGKAHLLHEIHVWNSNQSIESIFGVGAKDVRIETSLDGENWAVLNETPIQFDRAPGALTPATTVLNATGIVAQHVHFTILSNWGGLTPQRSLAEVRFFSLPVYAREPQPASGTTDVDPGTLLSWRAGRQSVSHEVFLGAEGADLQSVGSMNEPKFDVGTLDVQLGESYAWQVTEVNEAETPASWAGDIWTFSTPDALVVDDFEGYDNDAENFNRVFQVWVDGVGYTQPEPGDSGNGSGALVGTDQAPWVETNTVHSGRQSMPIDYDNTIAPFYSEAERTLTPAQDWTRAGVQTLVLFFAGDSLNTGGQPYVKINGVKVMFDGDANALVRPAWTQWNIDLASVNTNLQSVRTLAVGVDNSGTGLVYIDDMLLYKNAPTGPQEVLWIEAEATETRGGDWSIVDDGTASGGQFLGSEDGDGDDNTDPPGAEWLATYKVTVSGGTYSLSARLITSPGNSFWARILGAASPQITRPDGWINTGLEDGNAWHWDEDLVEFTLSAGEHTLEIAKREDGAFLDAFVLTKTGD